MLPPALAEKLRRAKLTLDGATSGNIIDLCQRYLLLLAESRSELYQLPDKLDLSLRAKSLAAQACVGDIRKAIRAAIEHTTQERNRVESLILSFTAISGYEAVMTFNRQKYQGRDDWQLSASGVSFSGQPDSQRLTIHAAVETASLLRREAHIATNSAPAEVSFGA